MKEYLFKAKLKQALKELFKSGEIEISADIVGDYDSDYIRVTVKIDGEVVVEQKEYIGSIL